MTEVYSGTGLLPEKQGTLGEKRAKNDQGVPEKGFDSFVRKMAQITDETICLMCAVREKGYFTDGAN